MPVDNLPITEKFAESERIAQEQNLPILGAVVAWEIQEDTALPRAVFTRLREQAGIPEVLEPPKLRDRNTAQRAINTSAKEDKAAYRAARGRRAKDVLALQEETDTHATYLWTTIESREDGTACFPVERRFRYDKGTRRCEAIEPDTLINARREYREAISSGASRAVLDEIWARVLRLEQEVEETQRRLDQLTSYFAGTILAKDIRAFLTRVVRFANGVPLRRMGGAYIVPAQTLFLVDAMKAFVKSLGNTSRVNTILYHDLRKLTNDDTNVETMLWAWEEHFLSTMQEKREQLRKYKESGRLTEEATLDQEIIELENLAEQAEMFAQLLGFQARKYLYEIAQTRDDVTEFAQAVARVRSERKARKKAEA